MKCKHLKHLFTALLLLCATVATAHDFEVGGIYYNILSETDKTVEVTYKDYSSRDDYFGSVVIPESVIYDGSTYSVTSIRESAFIYCSSLTSIDIPNSVTKIGQEAFYKCTGLKEVHISDLAAWCGIDFYGGSANPLYYAKNLYLNGELVTELEIPNSVTSIGNYAFYNCTGLTSIEIPNSVTSIGEWAFSDCTGLTSVEIPNSVTSIGEGVFSDCTGLTSVVIPNSVTSIGNYAFSNCKGLTSIEIPNSVTSIGSGAFKGCTGLTSIEIPNSVTSIGNDAFNGCTGLTSVEIPNSVTSIGDWAFSGCSGLKEVHISDLAAWCGIDFYGNSANPLCCAKILYLNGEKVTNLVIPEGVKDIKDYAFYNCTGLTSIEIPNSVTSIGDWTFSYCSSLTSIEIPNSVTSIGELAFNGCTGLTSVEIPNSVTSIGSSAFRDCTGLTSIEIPNSVTSIGDYALEGTAWYDNQPNGIVYAGKVLYKYKGTMLSNTSITIKDGTLGIAAYAFYNCTGLTSITIPNSVTSIGNYAFCGCKGLTSVEIPNSVTSIGDYAFYRCTGLESITVNSKTPPAIQSSTFSRVTATLYVPYGAEATYQAANYWKNFTNIVEMEASEYNLAVTSAGYATLYLGFDAEIPEGVEVYYAKSVEGDLLKMEQVTDYLPANTGVIVKATEGTYTFNETEESVAAIEGNLLKGTEKATTVKAKSNAQYYVLSKVDGVVGMYLAQLTDGGFLNNANKAYLELTLGDLGIYDDEVDSSANGVRLGAGYRFDFGGTTGVSELKTENGNVKIMYDLQGRKVENPTNGIYIINGKKMLVR